jgi:hypothetical protein
MGKARYLISFAAVVVAALTPTVAAAGTAAPQIYVGSGPKYTIAFKAEGPRVSVLALNAPIYCSFENPIERFPGSMYMFLAPTVMHRGAGGLEAPLRPGGGPSSYVRASLGAEKLTGTFALDQDEGSADCQTAGYQPAPPAVKFEAAPYEPVGSSATKPPGIDEVPIYYGNEGDAEVLIETLRGQIEFRGAAPTRCPVGGKQPKSPRSPLFGDIESAKRAADGSFSRTVHPHGQIGDTTWSEAITIAGAVEGDSITGTYRRTTTVRPAKGSPRTCKDDPRTFDAVRYLPAAGSR